MANPKKQAGTAPASIGETSFRGFGAQALPFLQALSENNEREWFNVNKSIYLEECDAPLRELVRAVGTGLEARGIPLAPMVKNPVFRIYRDVRFSKNKSPYKTHVGAALHPEGDKSRPGLLYIHVEPGKSFLAAGYYQPDPALLKTFRTAIADDPAGFAQLIDTLHSQGLKLEDGEPLARIPKGFEDHAAAPIAAYLRKRSLVTSQPLADDDLEGRDLPDVAIRFAIAALPLLDFFGPAANAHR